MSLFWLKAASHCRAEVPKSWSYFSSGDGVWKIGDLDRRSPCRGRPGQVVVEVGKPGRVVAGGGQGFEQAVGPGQDDVLPGRNVAARRGDQLVVAVASVIVSTRPLPPAQGSWIESALVGQ